MAYLQAIILVMTIPILAVEEFMSPSQTVLIDFSEAGLERDRAELEEYLLNLADEMQSGNLVKEAQLARESEIPEGARSGAAAFLMGVLTAEVSLKNIRKVLDFLGNMVYGEDKKLVVSGEMDGMTYNIEYRSQEDVDRAIDTIERLSNIRIKILEEKAAIDEGGATE